MYKFRMYIPFGRDIELLNKAIDSVVPQIREFSNYEGKKIIVINNSMKSIDGLVHFPEEVEIWQVPFEVTQAQEANWMIKAAMDNGEPFCMTTHTDSELLPDAMGAMLRQFDRIKDTKWSVIGSLIWHTVFALYNVEFFKQEDVWFDTFLFPFYFMDNHMGRLMTLRGWPGYMADSAVPIINHVRSHYLRDDDIFRRKNDIAFKHHAATYAEIWGGAPGYEKSNDIYAAGTLPRKQ